MSTSDVDPWLVRQLRRDAAALQAATISGIEAASAVDAIRIHKLVEALRPFVAAYQKRDHIADSDLDNEQPICLYVTLGDGREAQRVLREIAP